MYSCQFFQIEMVKGTTDASKCSYGEHIHYAAAGNGWLIYLCCNCYQERGGWVNYDTDACRRCKTHKAAVVKAAADRYKAAAEKAVADKARAADIAAAEAKAVADTAAAEIAAAAKKASAEKSAADKTRAAEIAVAVAQAV